VDTISTPVPAWRDEVVGQWHGRYRYSRLLYTTRLRLSRWFQILPSARRCPTTLRLITGLAITNLPLLFPVPSGPPVPVHHMRIF